MKLLVERDYIINADNDTILVTTRGVEIVYLPGRLARYLGTPLIGLIRHLEKAYSKVAYKNVNTKTPATTTHDSITHDVRLRLNNGFVEFTCGRAWKRSMLRYPMVGDKRCVECFSLGKQSRPYSGATC